MWILSSGGGFAPRKKVFRNGVTLAARGRETAGRGSPAAEGLLLSDSKCE